MKIYAIDVALSSLIRAPNNPLVILVLLERDLKALVHF